MIKRSAVDAFLRRHLSSFLWMKQLKREDLLAEFKHYKVKPVFKTEPWIHQSVGFHIAMCNPNFLFFYDMGLGKTAMILNIITQLQREKKLKRALVTVNGQLTIGSWDTAIATHSDLHPILVTGSIDEKWEKLISPKGDIAIIDYPGLHLALAMKVKQGKKFTYIKDEAKIKQLQKIYNFFTADESHKIKSSNTLRFSILKSLTQTFQSRYAMTGTPMGRNPADVWSQFYLTDRGETFSESLGMFRSAFFLENPNYWGGSEFIFDKHKERLFNQLMQNRSLRYTEDECNDIPTRNEIVIKLDFTPEQREHYLLAVEGLVSAGGVLAHMDNCYHKMRQVVAGFQHWRDEYGEHTVRFESNPKLEMLEALIEDSGDSKIVISTEYTESGKMIADMLTRLEIGFERVYGGTKDKVAAKDRFIADPIKRVFLMQSEVGGTGVDGLQDVARYLIFYESPTSPITRKQVIKRVHRSGQLRRTFIYDLVIASSIDVRVLSFISEGLDLHTSLVDGHSNVKQLLLL